MTESAKKKDAVLLLVRELLSIEGVGGGNGGLQSLPEKYEDLREGTSLYRILACIDPQTFTDADEIARQASSSRHNPVVRKENLTALVRHMNDYAHQQLGAPDTLNLTLLINPTEIANIPDFVDNELQAARTVTENKGMEQLMELTDIFVVIVVLSGDPVILHALKSLPHAEQVILSNLGKSCITKHAMRPRRRYGAQTTGDSTHSAAMHSRGASNRGESSHNGFHQISATSTMDEAAVNNQISRLRREIDDANARVVELDSKLHLTLAEKQEWESKYKALLAEAELRRTATVGEDHLRELLRKKEGVIQTLTATIEGDKKKMSAFKEATAAQEVALASLKRKLKRAEEELMKKNVERRDALNKLLVAEENLSSQMGARAEMERQLEDLRTELTLVRTQSNNNNASDYFGDSSSNRSFGSVNSIDRVVQLENELDEARNQKEAAERLLHVLQRQVASLPSEGFKPSAAMDAIKAQLRQAEKEKEELRNQLAVTIARLEEGQNNWRSRGGGSIVGSETESLVGGGTSGDGGGRMSVRDVDGGAVLGQETGGGDLLSNKQRRPHENPDDVQRENILLGSTLLLLGYRNLMLQQQAMLTKNSSLGVFNKGRGEEEDEEKEEGDATYNNSAHTTGPAVNTGSFLTRHRHEVEQGLVLSVLNRRG